MVDTQFILSLLQFLLMKIKGVTLMKEAIIKN
jgi:hypothetical protein